MKTFSLHCVVLQLSPFTILSLLLKYNIFLTISVAYKAKSKVVSIISILPLINPWIFSLYCLGKTPIPGDFKTL